MEHVAVKILNRNRIMAISTVRPDGWPQTTTVGYVNRGFEIFFLIFRSGQKYHNLKQDDRVAIAVASEPASLAELTAVYAGGHAVEITDEAERENVWKLSMQRASNLWGFKIPEATEAAFMRMMCRYVSVLDFSQGLGHREQLVIDERGQIVDGNSEKDSWTIATTD